MLVLAAQVQSMPALVLPPHSLPPAALHPPSVLRGPQERAATQSYISPPDYPAEALGASGKVGFSLTIGPDGRVIGCAITRSSGSAALDGATCRLIERRARYVPAVDSDGNPVVGTIHQEVIWKAP
jgi:protein TonB